MKISSTTPPVAPSVLDNVDGNVAAVKMGTGAGLGILWGITLNEWVAILTIAYMIMQIGLLAPKYCQLAREIYAKWKF